ncbi:MAG TPA: ABC transporter permease [Streptosporangiaceae bacterium]|nr:ABC transporter permease [Streptosporangiaceae bacterium]
MSTLSLALPRLAASRRAAFAKIVHNEARLAWRRPVGLIAGAGIPVLLVVIFGNVSGFQQPMPGIGGFTIFDAYVPILAVFALAMIALLALPVPLASYRELGVLRRLSTTPVPRTWLLAAQGVVQLGVALIALVVIFGISIVAFGARAPVSPAGLLLSIGLSAVGLFPIGLMVAAVARTANAASIIGRLAFFPLIFFAGLWLPQDLMPVLLRDISYYTPLGAAVRAIQSSMLTGFPPAAPLLVLAGYAVAAGFLARRFFRWE